MASSAREQELTPLLYLAGAERLMNKKTSADDAEKGGSAMLAMAGL